MQLKDRLQLDEQVSDCVFVEVKAVKPGIPIHKAQLSGYMKRFDVPPGRRIHFHERNLIDGVSCWITPAANVRNDLDR